MKWAVINKIYFVETEIGKKIFIFYKNLPVLKDLQKPNSMYEINHKML